MSIPNSAVNKTELDQNCQNDCSVLISYDNPMRYWLISVNTFERLK